jgi:hypothetical protein
MTLFHACMHASPCQVPNPDHITPGPGSYGSWHCKHHRPGSAPTEHGSFKLAQQQLFGRTAGRQECVGGLSWGGSPASPGPGPGSYNVPAALSKFTKDSWAVSRSTPASPAGTQKCGIDGSTEVVTAGFGSTCSRFGDAHSNSPGPGEAAAAARSMHCSLLDC